MYGLAVNLIVSVSGHPWIINEMLQYLLREERPHNFWNIF